MVLSFTDHQLHSQQLSKKGIFQLETIPGTRNRKKILLTKAGQKLVDHSVGKVDEIESNAFKCFTLEERNTYIALSKRHLENLR